ncbi:hypothetical protein BC567DRAFT_10088 [Phyllosticta citribraziliensis]
MRMSSLLAPEAEGKHISILTQRQTNPPIHPHPPSFSTSPQARTPDVASRESTPLQDSNTRKNQRLSNSKHHEQRKQWHKEEKKETKTGKSRPFSPVVFCPADQSSPLTRSIGYSRHDRIKYKYTRQR